MCVSDTTLQASVVKGTTKFRHQRSVNDTLQCFDSWILLGSRDIAMAKFVSQEAYDRASLPEHLPETSAHMINHMLLQFVIEHMLFFQSSSVRSEEVRHPCTLCHYFYIPRPRSHIKLYIEYDFNYMKGARRCTDVVPPLSSVLCVSRW